MITRVVTAFMVGPASLVAMYLGGWYLTAAVGAIAFFVASELMSLVLGQTHKIWQGIGVAVVLSLVASTQVVRFQFFWNLPVVQILALSIVGFQIIELLWGRPWFPNHPFIRWTKVVTVLSFVFPYFCLIRHLPAGGVLLGFVCMVAWFGDTVAYFVGKKWGRRPLAPRISPNKTIEGAIGGLLGSLGFALIYSICFNLPIGHFLVYAIGFAVLAQLGDLHESLVKRFFKVKDSSRLLPGHGGMYDRTDSTHLLIAVGYYLLRF